VLTRFARELKKKALQNLITILPIYKLDQLSIITSWTNAFNIKFAVWPCIGLQAKIAVFHIFL